MKFLLPCEQPKNLAKFVEKYLVEKPDTCAHWGPIPTPNRAERRRMAALKRRRRAA